MLNVWVMRYVFGCKICCGEIQFMEYVVHLTDVLRRYILACLKTVAECPMESDKEVDFG